MIKTYHLLITKKIYSEASIEYLAKIFSAQISKELYQLTFY